MNREGKKCVIYIRVSTEMQVDGFSLDAQKNTLKRFAEREGMIVKEVYEDAGKSGKSIEGRPAFRKLLNDIENGLEIDFVLVYKLSRFGRNAADILTSLELIQSYDINLIATEEGIDSSQTSGKLLISVLSAVSEIERENILEQTMNGRKEKARQGGWNGGFAPYGYKLINGELEVEPEEAETIMLIFDMYGNSNRSLLQVVKELVLQGIEKKVRSKKGVEYWSISSVKAILDNPIYCGYMPYGRRTKKKVKGSKNKYERIVCKDYLCEKGRHTALISEELWKQVQTKRNSIAFKYEKYKGRDRIHLLSGILRCPICGSNLNTTKIKRNRNGEEYSIHYYTCNKRTSITHPCSYRKMLRKDFVEPYVVELINVLIDDVEFAEALKEQMFTKEKTDYIETELANYKNNLRDVLLSKSKLEKTIDTLPADTKHYDMILTDLNQRLYKQYDFIAELQEKIEDAEIRLNDAQSQDYNYNNIMTLISNFNKIYTLATEEEKKMLLKMIFYKIDIYEDFTDGKVIKAVDLNFKLYNKNVEMLEMISQGDDNQNRENMIFHVEVTKEMQDKIFARVLATRPPMVEPQKVKINKEYKPRKPRVVTKPYKHSEEFLNKKAREHTEKIQKVTYKMIQDYILDKYNMKAHTSYIAEIKRKHGLDMQCVRQKEKTTQPVKHPTAKMAEAIEDAMKFFKLIE